MKDVLMLHGAEPRKILHKLLEQKAPAIISYLSKYKWHIAKVQIVNVGANKLSVRLAPRRKPYPVNIQPDQPVGISIKYGYGKFIFDTRVTGLEPPAEGTTGGVILLALPDKIEIVQRRNYFRVQIPRSLKVNTVLWPRRQNTGHYQEKSPEYYWTGSLVDISAGGAQVAISTAQNPDLKKGQFVTLRFTPLPYEKPLMFNAQVRSILPTADEANICFGLQIIGLEASPEGHQVLQRLCGVVERYYEINRSTINQRDFAEA